MKCKPQILCILATVLIPLFSRNAESAVITGPPLTLLERLYFTHGIAFNAIDNSTLSSFTYVNQGQEDIVDLSFQSTPGVILDSIVVPSGNTSFSPNVNWSLIGGDSYLLLAGGEFNGTYATGASLFPMSDQDISVTSGSFSGEYDPNDWGDFNNITTNSVPEPSIAVAAVMIVAILSVRLPRRHYRNNHLESCNRHIIYLCGWLRRADILGILTRLG